MCIAFVDPGNLEADLQTGAQTGYSLLWVLLWATTMGFLLQALAARLGVASRHHLAQHCRAHYPTIPRIALWCMAELAIIGSDVQEVIGTAIALLLLSGGKIPLWVGVIIAAVAAYVLLLLEKLGQHWLERVFQVAIAVMSLSFATMFLQVGVPLKPLLKGLAVPKLTREAFPTACGLLGSIIMPHNLYLHSALVHSRALPPSVNGQHQRVSKKESIHYYTIESIAALFVTFIINICVISVFSFGFYKPGEQPPATTIGLENAGQYLGERFGHHMAFIWAIGLLAAGQSSTMTGTYAGQFVMSGFLKLKIKPTTRALLTRAVALVPTLFVAIRARDDSTKLDQLNQGLNILQSVQLPFAVVPLLLFTSNSEIMGGKKYTTPRYINTIAWVVSTLIMAVNFGTIYGAAVEWLAKESWVIHVLFWFVLILYAVFVAYLVMQPVFFEKKAVGSGRSGVDAMSVLHLNDGNSIASTSFGYTSEVDGGGNGDERSAALRQPLID